MNDPDDDYDVPMPSDENFWAIVDLAREDFPAFRRQLEGMDRADLIGFAWMFEELSSALYDPKYHGNRYSEDVTEGYAAWIVAQGREAYERTLAHPDLAPEVWNRSEIGLQLWLEAEDVYSERFGEELPPLE